MQARQSHTKISKILNTRETLRFLSPYQSIACIAVNTERFFSCLFFAFCFLAQTPFVVKAGLRLLVILLAQLLSARVTGLHHHSWLSDSCELRACAGFPGRPGPAPPSTPILSHPPPLAPGTVREQLPNTIQVFMP